MWNVHARQEKARSSSQALWFSPSLFWSSQWFCMRNALYFHNFQSILVSVQNVKDLACAPGAGFANVRLLSLASLVLCSKRQQKATPQGWNFGLHLGSPSTPRRKAQARVRTHTHTHTHTQHSVLKTLQLTQSNPNTQNSFDVP